MSFRIIIAVFINLSLILFGIPWTPFVMAQEPIIVDHNCTDITKIPQTAIEQAKTNLHIAYGHTSHGSQLTTGMNGLISFANGIGNK